MYYFIVEILSLFARLFFSIHFTGIENIPRDGKLIVCCNHKSVIDPFLLMMKFPRKIYFMAKIELFTDHGKFVGWILRKMGAFPVHRNKVDTQSIKKAIDVLEHNQTLGIFPQGGCVRENDVEFKPKAGIGLIAAKAKAPVLPACIYSKGKIRPFRRIYISFGKVIPYCELGFQQGTAKERHTAAKIISASVCTLLERNDISLQK